MPLINGAGTDRTIRDAVGIRLHKTTFWKCAVKTKLRRIWNMKQAPDRTVVERLAVDLGVSAWLASVLAAREITDPKDAKSFLSPDRSYLNDPFDLPDMDKAVSRIVQAREKSEKVFIYGDYDVDGVCATVLMDKALRTLGLSVEHYIPNRLQEGYGLSERGLNLAAERSSGLVLTVDTGTNAAKEVEHAHSLGMDVLITDHHEVSSDLPDAVAVVNPKRPDSEYPFRDLAGVGVALKLVSALSREFPVLESVVEGSWDIVGLGTIADMVELTGENRTLTIMGLRRIGARERVGIDALLEMASISAGDVNARSVAFGLAPRLNAAGRMGNAELAFELLSTEDRARASIIARDLDEENRHRRRTDSQMLADALDKMKPPEVGDRSGIVLWSDSWHVGVLGIVASRIVDKFQKPAVLIAMEEDQGRGSGRSVKGFHLSDVLEELDHLLVAHGGHELAGGFVIERENLEKFADSFDKLAQSALGGREPTKSIDIDAGIDLRSCDLALAAELETLRPFGVGNPEPVFYASGIRAGGLRIVGTNHLRMTARQDNHSIGCIGFNLGEMYEDVRSADTPISLAFSLQQNRWQGVCSPQLRVRDIALGPPPFG